MALFGVFSFEVKLYFWLIHNKNRMLSCADALFPPSHSLRYSHSFLSFIFMFNVNRVTLLGNATRDAEARVTKTDTAVTSIGMATSRPVKDADGKVTTEPDFHRLVCFGSLAEFSLKSVSKGTPLYIEGRLHTSSYKNRKGEQTSRTEVIVDRLVLLSSKKGKTSAEEVAA